MGTEINYGISLGSILAMILSWTTNHSLPYLVGHAILSWFYVIYWLLTYT